MLRLEESRESHLLRVSGRIDAENLAELRMQMRIHSSPIALELGEVTLVDADAVRFLATAEAAGTELRNCPLFVREWIRRERLSSQDVSEMNQPRIHVFSRNDGTQYQFTEKEK